MSIRRWDGTAWGDAVPRRWTGSAWVPVASAKRWDGSAWVEMLTAGGAPTVDAGADATLTDPTAAWARTATETAGSGGTITARAWSIIDGPLGAGTTIGTAAALSWTPGVSADAATTTDLRQPVCKEMALELNASAENSTVDWTQSYDYIEDIHDQRGYTAGLVGFCSGTGDMLALVQEYTDIAPGNPLSSYLEGLQTCAQIGYGSGASAAAATYLGAGYIAAWISAATDDPIFRQVQRAFRDRVYYDPALEEALADGCSPLGLCLHYDVSVNHGPGDDSQSYGGIIAAARAATPPPSQGGSEAAYLLKICDLRDAVLQAWGDYQTDGRSSAFRSLINGGHLALAGTIGWSVYGDAYTMTRPSPPADARVGVYTLQYAATNSGGTGTDEVTVTVTNESQPEPPQPLFENLVDSFDDNTISSTLWPESYGAVTEVNGRARVPAGASYAAYESARAWQLQGSHLQVQVPMVPSAGGTDEAYCAFSVLSPAEGTSIGWTYNLTTQKLRAVSNTDYWDDNAVQLTYSGTTHRWWRISESGGTVTWATSPDGTTWTTRRTLATPSWVVGATTLGLLMECRKDTGTVSYAEFDNLNTTP